MTRIIKLETCESCPFRDHGGAFGKIAYVPTCSKSGGRALPYKEMESRPFQKPYAIPTYKIPSWCPLEKAV